MKNKWLNSVLSLLFIIFIISVYVMDVGYVRTRVEGTIEERKTSMQPVLDKSISDRISKEDGVQYAHVYVTSYVALTSIIVDDKLPQDKAKTIADNYGDLLKKKYSDKEISLKVVKLNGNTVYQKTINK